MPRRRIVISLQHVSKQYVFRHSKPTLIGRLFRLDREKTMKALDAVDVTIRQGERVGIIGLNGSGKTTFLKIIAGITSPTSGRVTVHKRVTSLIDLEAGFHPELSGRENIFLNGLVIGMRRQEIRRVLQKIITFSGLQQFIDEPLFTYSQGMSLRLGFSVAAFSRPEILILDEGLSVGDESFMKKVERTVERFFKEGKTILVASHWLEWLRENCDRIIWLEDGKVKGDGGTEVIDAYRKTAARRGHTV